MTKGVPVSSGSEGCASFEAVIGIRGINPFIHVDAQTARRIRANWRRPLPVLVRINRRPRQPWRINLMPVGDGSFYLYLHESVRKASNTGVGDRVLIEVRFDDAYRGGPMHPMPEYLRAALGENERAGGAWLALAPSRRKEVLRYLANLKTEETRSRNLRRLLDVLSGIEGRFMGRTWTDGR